MSLSLSLSLSAHSLCSQSDADTRNEAAAGAGSESFRLAACPTCGERVLWVRCQSFAMGLLGNEGANDDSFSSVLFSLTIEEQIDAPSTSEILDLTDG